MEDKIVTRIIQKINNARRKAFEKTLPKGKTYNDAVKEEAKKLKKYLAFLENYIDAIFDSLIEIEIKIKSIKAKTNQNLNEEKLIKELWILRYAFLLIWFFNFIPPKDQNELEVYIALINRAFSDVRGTSDYLPWLTKGFTEYAGTNQLSFSNLEESKSHILEKVEEKIPLITFECTEGRLGGELHDSVIELIMTTVERDGKLFETGERSILADGETEDIKKTIQELKSEREKAAKDFFN